MTPEQIHVKRMNILHFVNDRFEYIINLPRRLPATIQLHKDLKKVLIENLKSPRESYRKGLPFMTNEHKSKIQEGRKTNRKIRQKRFDKVFEEINRLNITTKEIYMKTNKSYMAVIAAMSGKSLPNNEFLLELESIVANWENNEPNN